MPRTFRPIRPIPPGGAPGAAAHEHPHPHDHPHPHPHPGGAGESLDPDSYQRLEALFAAGYRAAADRMLFLRLAHIPFQLPEPGGAGALLLKDLRLEESYAVGQVAPAFASVELVHHVLPHELVRSQSRLVFVYVNKDGPVEKSLAELYGLVVTDAAHDH